MPLTRKALALSVALTSMLSALTIAQGPKAGEPQQLVIDDAKVDWFQKSDVSALREGVIDKMELRIGKEVGQKGDVIGTLHKEVAELSVEEARIQASGNGAILKAQAQRDLAKTVVERNTRLLKKGEKFIPQEEVQKNEAEFAMADANLIEAQDTQKLAIAKLKSAERALEEHIIRAPFAGQVLEEFKHEGESVRANEPVVRIGNLDTVRVWAYIPVEYASRVKPGTDIVIQPRLSKSRSSRQPIEQRQFRGKISMVDKSVQPIAESSVRIYADLDNSDHELMPGLDATITIFLRPEGNASYVIPASGTQVTGGGNPAVGSRKLELPPLPR